MTKTFDPPSEDTLAELKSTYGDDMRVLEIENMTIVVALPVEDAKVQAIYKRYVEKMDEGKRGEALGGLFPTLCVYPEKDVISKVLARRPGIARVAAVLASELLGIVPGEVKKD